MIGNIVYGIWDNRDKLLYGYIGLAVISPRAAQKIGEIIVRVSYAALKENVRTIGAGLRETAEVLTRKPGAARPPIIPVSDKAVVKRQAQRLLIGGVRVLATPQVAVGGAVIGGGLLVSHGIGQLPDVKKTATIGQQYVMGAPL